MWALLIIFVAAFAGTSRAAGSLPILPSPEDNQVLIEKYDNISSPVKIVDLLRPAISGASAGNRENALIARHGNNQRKLNISDIRALRFLPQKRISYYSHPDSTLVKKADKGAETASEWRWYDPALNDSEWRRPVLAHPNYRWFYIPGATWIWRKTDYKPRPETLLARKHFTMPESRYCRRAVIYITVDDTLKEIYLNGRLISNREMSLAYDYAALDITRHIRKGENVLALKVAKRPDKDLSFAGVAFRIDLELMPGTFFETCRPEPAGSAIFMENGDLIFGKIKKLNDRSIEIRTRSGDFVVDRDWVRKIFMNYSSDRVRVKENKNIFHQIIKLGAGDKKYTQDKFDPFSFFTYPADQEKRMGILLKSGDFINGRILAMDRHHVTIKPRYGPEFSVNFWEVDSIYPNLHGRSTYVKYPSEQLPWRTTVTTIDGLRLSGLLMDLEDKGLTLRPPYSEEIMLDRDSLASCVFPYSSVARLKNHLNEEYGGERPRVAIIGENNPRGPEYEHSTYFKIQCILSELSMEGKLLTPEEMVNHEFFSADKFPILFNLDETESYYKSVNTKNDGFRALYNYVKEGGRLAHVAVGFPGFYGHESRNDNWVRTTSPPYLNRELRMNILTPGEYSDKAQAFELPDNRPAELYFELVEDSGYGEGLPERVDFPFNHDSRFRPIISEDDATSSVLFTPVYRLKDEAGNDYGPAMAVIDYKNGEFEPTRAFYVHHLVFTSEYNGHSMLNYIIPRIVSLAVDQNRNTIVATSNE